MQHFGKSVASYIKIKMQDNSAILTAAKAKGTFPWRHTNKKEEKHGYNTTN